MDWPRCPSSAPHSTRRRGSFFLSLFLFITHPLDSLLFIYVFVFFFLLFSCVCLYKKNYRGEKITVTKRSPFYLSFRGFVSAFNKVKQFVFSLSKTKETQRDGDKKGKIKGIERERARERETEREREI